jgi:DNA-binding response OmpR family regulator
MHVLLIEDEHRLASAIARGFGDRGIEVTVSHDGLDGYWLAKGGSYDAIVLDLMLPGLPGLEVCRRLRAEAFWTPILVLTAKDRESDETDCLEVGADDYLRKPFSFAVLVARCRALARRGPAILPAELRVGDLVIDPRRRTARLGEIPLTLTPREFALLELLARNAGQVLSKEQILRELWGEEAEHDPNVVEVYISYLRRKLDVDHASTIVDTVRGRGYVLEEKVT